MPESPEPSIDDLVSFNVARSWLPRSQGRKISIETLYRWCHRGLVNGNRLQAVKVGGRWFTTRKWVQDFIRAGQPDLTAENFGTSIRTRLQRERAAAWAERELRRLWSGLGRSKKARR
jgi:hypothetical protein